MAKFAEPAKNRKLTRSRNVSSFLKELSTESATSPKTLDVVVDIHNESRQQRDDSKDLDIIELSDIKKAKRFSVQSSGSSKSSLRASDAPSQNRTSDRTKKSSKEICFRQSRDELTESFDLIEEFKSPDKEKRKSPEEKPRRRKQWNTVANEETPEIGPKKPPRKRWSKDTGVIQLPETTNSSVPLIETLRKPPVPAPRGISTQQSEIYHFDNPAFVSENDDEVLRIETDHNRESTKIEMRKMSDRSRVEDVGVTSGKSLQKHRTEVAKATNRRRLVADESDDRSSKTRFLKSRKNSVEEFESSTSLEKITDLLSSSVASEDRSSTSVKKSTEATSDQPLKKRERKRELFKKKSSEDDAAVSSSARNMHSSSIEPDAKVRKKNRKKRKQEKKETKDNNKEIKYISVTIHRADVLEDDYLNAKRPMVKVHIVKARTGSYLPNTTKNRENDTAFLQPMITGKFDFRENKSLIPVWEEELIFEHDFNAIAKCEDDDQVVILFEVIDLLNFAEASLSYDKVGSEGCWYKIAWAFLKPVGVNNVLHTDKKVRLQLYRPKRNLKKREKQNCEVYTWWQSNNRDKYPSSLLVTVTSVPLPKLEPVLYQQLSLNDLSDTRSDLHDISMRNTSDSIGLVKWTRLAAQSCKIPNEKMFETEASENGCFYIAFSNDGKYLACVHSEEHAYPIVVYEVKSGKIYVRFLGHKAFVYSLNWSSDDHCLLSTSADQTVRVWNVYSQIVQHIEILPHPSYVYCAKYVPGKTTIVATGCYDRVVRIWANSKRSKKRELSQELESHEGFVNSMVFQKNGNLITADSVGSIILWTVRRNNRMTSKMEWCFSRQMKISEIEGVIINTIALHPLESRLLIHSRDNGLRMLDLATGIILQKYKQLNNQRIQLKACISPCGRLILCGGEDSVLNIWNLETGKHVAKYTNGGRSKTVVTCVDYHPYDHVLAFSTFGSPTPVRVLRFNKTVDGSDVGLNLTGNATQAQHDAKEVNFNILDHSSFWKSKVDRKTKEMRSSLHNPAVDHIVIQIENEEQSWAKLRRLRDMELSWKERSRDRLHCIIQKIDSMLSKKSMFSEDIIDGEQILNVNGCRENAYLRNAKSSASSNIALQQQNISHSDNTTNSTNLHNDLGSSDNARSDLATRSNNQNRSYDFHISTNQSEQTSLSRVSSPDSIGTYIVELPDFDKNVNQIATKVEDTSSVLASESDCSRVSNATFVIKK
ncbi:jouberin-like [Pseudomyrmex gracilis]|uniref:jouberin-like n=1 Tax=Pseudomyrmex gracilis TaxID=219809 RepID=UPI0009959BCA|nr:jouberin-like [Pseudomyrmex gracilis]